MGSVLLTAAAGRALLLRCSLLTAALGGALHGGSSMGCWVGRLSKAGAAQEALAGASPQLGGAALEGGVAGGGRGGVAAC
ncbi:hypothetical protein ACFYYP_38975 [Microbispora rosea]|uniref:hypothetical protein n=1 Tax=Microbispora rosea TaxID=58117 RepID=UPI00369495C7